MKKFFVWMLACVLAVLPLAGCSLGGGLGDLSGTDAAKLLLAQERLDSALLKQDGDIFENGAKILRSLSGIAKQNLVAPVACSADATPLAAETYKSDVSGYVIIDGFKYTWGDFRETCNSYGYFENLTGGVVSSAEAGADMIDNFKKNVRVVDTWIDYENTSLYLHVDENSETLIENYENGSMISICRRYRNEDGQDVYEVFHRNDDGTENSMLYIPGVRYEFSMDFNQGSQNLIADNSKGYWEVYIPDAHENGERFNTSYFIMKDDICYDAHYENESGKVGTLKIISADRKADMFSFADHNGGVSTIEIKFSGFTGVESVSIEVDGEHQIVYGGEPYTQDTIIAREERGSAKADVWAAIVSGDRAVVSFTNGKSVACYDSFYDGAVSVNMIRVGYGMDGYSGAIVLTVHGEEYEERLSLIRRFIEDMGLECRRDLDETFESIERTYVDVEGIIKYYTWHGVNVSTPAGIAEAFRIDQEKDDALYQLYTDAENAPRVDGKDAKALELKIKFAPITAQSFDASYGSEAVAIKSASLTIEDTTLYVEGEPYKLGFALAASTGLVHLDVANSASVTYAGEESFLVSANDVIINLPYLNAGGYTLVGYISTTDGIRASEYVPITFGSVEPSAREFGGVKLEVSKGTDESLSVRYSTSNEIHIQLDDASITDYQSLLMAMGEIAYEHGIPSTAPIEIDTGLGWQALKGDEVKFAHGTYRLGYSLKNGGELAEGFVYATID
ncbi:MAG: hypothetical protein E7610_03185 [Ruminococcaceae bacterium]|nr:hypothetical protein [Oscillospiraceae bacterium]